MYVFEIWYSVIFLNANDLKLSFGAKGGLHMLDTDWSKGSDLPGHALAVSWRPCPRAPQD